MCFIPFTYSAPRLMVLLGASFLWGSRMRQYLYCACKRGQASQANHVVARSK